MRLGKLLYSSEIDFVADCPTMGGDSGGPYFDLNGRLIGICDGAAFLPMSCTPTAQSIWAADGCAELRSRRFAVDLNVWPEARRYRATPRRTVLRRSGH